MMKLNIPTEMCCKHKCTPESWRQYELATENITGNLYVGYTWLTFGIGLVT